MNRFPTPLSLQLSHVLDGYGLTRSFIEYRRKICDYTLHYLLFDLHDCYRWSFITGSKRDALCPQNDTESDMDVICVLDTYPIVSETDLHKPSECFILEKTHKPGYFFLKINGDIRGFKHLISFRGCMYLGNSIINEFIRKLSVEFRHEIHGPAISLTFPGVHGLPLTCDNVIALHCNTLPPDFGKWCSRKRDNSWPPKWIIDATKKNGCLLVGVGHPASETNTIEWRLSLNQTEHLLTKSFNKIQIKCFVLLRLVLKWIIQPQIKNSLSSYHVKTVMFWMCEEREKQFWKPKNLAECFMCSLIKLRTYVDNKNCPSYFLTDVNLLEGKLEGDNHHIVLEILDNIIAEGPAVVYGCLPFNAHIIDGRCQHLIQESCTCLHDHLIEERIKEITDNHIEEALEDVLENDLLNKEQRYMFTTCQLGILDWHVVNEFYNQSISNSHTFSSLSVCEELGLPKKRLYSLQKEYIAKLHGDGYVARIKLATFFYYRRQLSCSIPLLSRVIESMESCRDFEMCVEEAASASHVEKIEGVECIYLTQNYKGFLVSEIVFSPCDKLFIPPDLQDEMGRPKTVNGMYYEGWVFVDSIVYAYYLLFLACHDLRWNRGIISLFRRFHKVCAQDPGAIRIFRKDIAYRLYCRAFMLVWAFTKGFTELS